MTKLNLVKGKTVDETDTTSNGISFAGGYELWNQSNQRVSRYLGGGRS